MELRVGDPELTNPNNRTEAIDWHRLQRSLRFGFGLAGLFLSTVVLTLAVVALVTTVIPRWHSTVVASESMEPALRRGDAVLYSEYPIDEVGAGTIIVFDRDDGSIIHRIVGVNPDGTLVTRGDANQSNDSAAVTAEQFAGAGRVVVPWVGIVRLWWLDGRYELVIATLAVLLIAIRGAGLSREPENDPWIGDESPSPATDWLFADRPLVDDTRLLGGNAHAGLLARMTPDARHLAGSDAS